MGQISQTTEHARVDHGTKKSIFSPVVLYKNSVSCLQEFYSLPHVPHLAELSSTSLTSSQYAVSSKGRDWFCSHSLRASSPVPFSPPVNRICSTVPQLVRGRPSFSTLMNQGPALPFATGSEGQEVREGISPPSAM